MATFSDDFNRSDSTNLGANWVEVSGDWAIASNRLSPGSAGGTIILRAAGAMDTNDHFAQITITATTAASHGIWIRGNSNITQGYLVRNNGSSWDLFYVVGGSFTVIGTYAVAAVANDVVKLQAVGSAIKVYINGTLRISVTDTVVPTGTSVGVRSESTNLISFDDFSAGDITAGATLGIASETSTAQALAGAKTSALTPAAETSTAQLLTGAKAATLNIAAATESAQALPGTKSSPLGTAAATETAQPLAGAKTLTLGVAFETATAQLLTGTKTTPLAGAAQTETAQALTGAKATPLGVAVTIEAAQSASGGKTGALTPAAETSTARPLTAGGPNTDITITVGAPYSPWTADPPRPETWATGQPQQTGWEVASPW